jgi:hypothetical protein
MPAFPAYGELLLSGFNEKPESALVRTEMESGPSKQARVRSLELVKRNVTYVFTSAQYITWKAWRNTDLSRGALWFDWTNPLTGTTVQARMENGDYSASAYNANDTAIKWEVSFVLETYE